MYSSLTLFLRGSACALALFLMCASLQAAAPLSTNDTCASAMTIPGSGPFPYWTPVMDIFNATTNGDPSLLFEDTTNVFNYQTSLTHSVWFKFTPSATARYSISLGADTVTTIDDTVLAVFTATGGTCAGATNLYDFSDDPGPLHAALATNLTAGVTYWFVAWVGPIEELTNQPLNLQLRVNRLAVPANDNCSGAITISASAALTNTFTITNDTSLATENLNDPEAPCIFGYRNVWYKFTPTTTAWYFFSNGPDTGTTIDDPAMALFVSSSCPGSSATAYQCNDTTLGRDIIGARLTNGVTYYLTVYDNSPDPVPGETSVQIRVGRVTAPTLETMVATGLSSTGAVLNASVNPNGSANSVNGPNTRYWFEWGTSTNTYSFTNTARLLSLSSTSILVTATVTNLQPGTPYHYRVVATNIIDKAFGQNRTLQWTNWSPLLSSPARLPDGEFQFQFAAKSNQVYMVQGSTNLTQWLDLGLSTEVNPGQFQFHHPNFDSTRFRFYKVRLP